MFVQCAFSVLTVHVHVFLTWKMEEVDPEGALKMYVDTKDWEKCLELASKQVYICTYMYICVCNTFFIHKRVEVYMLLYVQLYSV